MFAVLLCPAIFLETRIAGTQISKAYAKGSGFPLVRE
jgi:hypothetical protein